MSADEIDAELLALAGDDSDDEPASPEQEPRFPQSPSQEPQPSVEKTEAAAQSRRGVAQKVRKRGRKKATRRELEDELDDLRDDSPSPAASVGSGEMLQSDSEADAPASPEADEGPQYVLEGKFTSAADRTHILSLPEIEREEILAERAQEILKRQQDLQLKKAFAASQFAAGKHKRKAAAAELEDDEPRKSSRPKSEKRSALDNYKKAREAKGTERNSRFDQRRERRDDGSATPSDRDAAGESDVEYAEPSSYGRRDRDEPPPELKDFERCRVGRSNFATVCFYPAFESAIKGCFCRVSIGMNRETGQNMYRMTQVKGFVEGKPYQLEGSNGKQFTTDQYALVAHGSAEKPWPFSACSDSKFSEGEFERYKETLEKEHIRLPRRTWLLQKLDDIHQFLHPQWDEQTLQTKLARQRAMEDKFNPTVVRRRKLDSLLRRKAEAEQNEDAEEAARCEAELAALENRSSNGTNGADALPAKSSPLKPVHATSRQEHMAFLNQKNRGRNVDLVRNALLEERRKLKQDRVKAYEAEQAKLAAKEAAAAAAVEAETKRRQAALLAAPGQGDLFGDTPNLSRAGTPMSGIGTPKPKLASSRAGTPMNGIKKEGVVRPGIGLVVAKKRAEEEDGFADLDLEIDVEI